MPLASTTCATVNPSCRAGGARLGSAQVHLRDAAAELDATVQPPIATVRRRGDGVNEAKGLCGTEFCKEGSASQGSRSSYYWLLPTTSTPRRGRLPNLVSVRPLLSPARCQVDRPARPSP